MRNRSFLDEFDSADVIAVDLQDKSGAAAPHSKSFREN
jgi:hypothetical protein